jgi:hypothetical protein
VTRRIWQFFKKESSKKKGSVAGRQSPGRCQKQRKLGVA